MSRIPELNKEAMEACQLYVDNLIKPIHSPVSYTHLTLPTT